MLNKILAAICKAEGLPSAGVKAELQNRICDSEFSYLSMCHIGFSSRDCSSDANSLLLERYQTIRSCWRRRSVQPGQSDARTS
jgi:hypothetical protein